MKAIIKTKIYAGKQKQQLLRQSLGNIRFVWNKFVWLEKEYYKQHKKFIRFAGLCREITRMRKEYEFLNYTSIWNLQQIARKFNFALRLFIKHKSKGYKFPSYKRKKNYDGILIYPKDFKINGKMIYLPKIGWVRIKDKATKKSLWKHITETAKQVWVKEEPDGFFAYIVYEKELSIQRQNGKIVGIDLGIRNTITISNGETISLPIKNIMRIAKKIEELQSIIDKKKHINKKRGIKQSKRVIYLERRRSKLLKRIKNIKYDFYQKTINHILKSHEYVVVENLELKELKEVKSENKKATKKIHKYLQYISLSKFYQILEYKAILYGRKIIKVNPKNTSKMCSRCGHINNITLSTKVFKCSECGFRIDRDLNASINIYKMGLSISSGQGEYKREMVSERIPIR